MKNGTVTGLLLLTVVSSSGWCHEANRAGQGYHWQKTPSSVALMADNRVVWQFNHLGDGKEKGVPYFHPLATPSGTVLTDRRPADHPWHRGLRFAWKKLNGLEGYWSWPEGLKRWPENNGMTEVTHVSVETRRDGSAQFELTLTYHPPHSPPLLTEHRTISVAAADEGGTYAIDWKCVFTAGATDVLLDRTPIPGEADGKPWGGYAGLQFRLAPRNQLAGWSLENARGLRAAHRIGDPRAQVRNSLLKLHGEKARWMNVVLELRGGKRGGVALLDHPANLRHPTTWHTSSMPNELIQTPLFEGPHRLSAGKQLILRYRVIVHEGAMTGDELERCWKNWTQ